MGSVEGYFELCWGHVAAVAAKAVLAEPVHPRQGGQLELVDVVQACAVGSVDALSLVEPVGRLGQRVDAPTIVEQCFAVGFRDPGTAGAR